MKKHKMKNSKPFMVLHNIIKKEEPKPHQTLQAMLNNSIRLKSAKRR